MSFVGYLAVGYAPVLVITDLAAVSCDCTVVAVEFATVEIEVAETEVDVGIAVAETEVVVVIVVAGAEVAETEVVGTKADNFAVVGTEVAETEVDNSVVADVDVAGIEIVGTEVADLMIGGVEAGEIGVHYRARCNASHLDGMCILYVDCTHDLHYLHDLGERDVYNHSRVPDSKVFCVSLLVFDILCT